MYDVCVSVYVGRCYAAGADVSGAVLAISECVAVGDAADYIAAG